MTAPTPHPGLFQGVLTVGRDKVRYFIFINGRWRWRPTKAMSGKGSGS